MKKFIIWGVVIAIIIAGGAVAYLYFNSFQKLTVVFKQPNVSGKIYERGTDTHEGEDDKEIRTIQNNETVSLSKGSYYIRPQGGNVKDDPVSFELADQPVTLEVDPTFSKDYLDEQLKNEKSAIDAALMKKYPQQLAQYTIGSGLLLEQGDWYGTTLTFKNDTEETHDVYRVVLHKVNNNWEVVDKPQLILTHADFPDVPVTALRDINHLN